MKKHYLLLPFSFILLLSLNLFSSCKKVNEATELGSNLIPPIDNVNTFDTTLEVETYNQEFDFRNDSIRHTAGNEQFLGYIGNDPLFGKTTASLYLQLKPAALSNGLKYSFPTKSNVILDSVVLITAYVETYGDSTLPQSFQVFEVAQGNAFKFDSNYLINKNNFTVQGNSISAVKTVLPSSFKDSIILYTKEKVANQLRIPLSASFGTRLLNYDSSATGAYFSDSAFNTFFKGFEIRPVNNTGNAVLGIDLLSTKTRLAFYYRTSNSATIDTVEYFSFTGRSASANYIARDRSSSEVITKLSSEKDDLVYLQNAPGTFARIVIPGLSRMDNRVVHRAELSLEQVFNSSDRLFAIPNYLYLDAFDATKNSYRSIPFDLSISTNGAYNIEAFGMAPKKTVDGANNPINVWRFDISRYVQRVLNRTAPNYELRLSAPFLLKTILSNGVTTTGVEETRTLPSINPTSTKGRVRVGGGNHPTQRMKLRIIYSKI